MAQSSEIFLKGPKVQQIRGRYSSLDVSEPARTAVNVVDNYGDLHYRIGNYDRHQNKIRWGQPHQYGSGRSPSVCLIYKEEMLYVVEVHCKTITSRLEYRIGKVNTQLMTILWNETDDNPDQPLAIGKKAKICATADGYVVAVYEQIIFNEIKYCIATTNIDGGNITINWGYHQCIPFVEGVEPNISISENKLVAVFRYGKLIQEIRSILGTLIHEENKIVWDIDLTKLGSGHNPCISINADMNIVVIYQLIGRRLNQVTGMLDNNDKVSWNSSCSSTYTLGEYPSVVLTDNNKIIEMHKSNFSHTVYQSEGRLEQSEGRLEHL